MDSNIKYDVKSYLSGKLNDGYVISAKTQEESEEKLKKHHLYLAEHTLKKKIGVCEHYSRLYKLICDLTNVECTLESGFCKTDFGELGGHAWNKVKIGDTWKGIDATWGAGYLNQIERVFVPEFNYNYCLVPLEKLNLNHLSSNMTSKKLFLARKTFTELPVYYGEYIGSSIELIEPLKGTILLNDSKEIIFRIKNLPKNKQLSYSFVREPNQIINEVVEQNEISIFKIPTNQRKGGILNIWIDNEPLVMYRLSTK